MSFTEQFRNVYAKHINALEESGVRTKPEFIAKKIFDINIVIATSATTIYPGPVNLDIYHTACIDIVNHALDIMAVFNVDFTKHMDESSVMDFNEYATKVTGDISDRPNDLMMCKLKAIGNLAESANAINEIKDFPIPDIIVASAIQLFRYGLAGMNFSKRNIYNDLVTEEKNIAA